LQRRLQQEGTTFAEVIDTLRHELARGYLEQGVGLPDVAELLGYADVTAFHHAFRRWTGESPSRYARAKD
jgi:AraC-like DNA-binding protein